MDLTEIKRRVEELEAIMRRYRKEMGVLEKSLYDAVVDYKVALHEERLKEIKKELV